MYVNNYSANSMLSPSSPKAGDAYDIEEDWTLDDEGNFDSSGLEFGDTWSDSRPFTKVQ